MRLSKDVVMHDVGSEHMVVPTGALTAKLNGMVKNNASANMVYELLKNDITEDEIVDALFAKYEAPREVIAADVHQLLSQMRELGFLEE